MNGMSNRPHGCERSRIRFVALILASALLLMPAHAHAMDYREESLVVTLQQSESAIKIKSLSLSDAISPKRINRDEVLDTYGVFHCYKDPSHDESLWLPSYKTITYQNGYTRKQPDHCYDSYDGCPCPHGNVYDPHKGLMKWYECDYEIW